MEPLYKQRLVGAVVLVAIAVIVVPLILGEPRRDRQDPLNLAVGVPPMPVIEPPPAVAPEPVDPVSAALEAPAAPAALPAAWVVQAASFKAEAEALALVTRLRKQSLEAWLAAPSAASGQYRVLIGPELERATADGLSQRLRREFKLNASVQAYALD